jgi:peptidoglycan/xylan/chitin deacetylase (PgdA/CDA1 family)
MRKLESTQRIAMNETKAGWTSYLGRNLMAMLSPSGSRARLSILIYHRVLAQPDPLFPGEVDAKLFDSHMRLLKSCFNIIPLGDAINGLRHGNLPPRAACVTFDDGYADNAEIALPILQKHRVHATFFVATGFLNGGRMWNDTVIELVRRTTAKQIDLRPIGLELFETCTLQERQYAIQVLLSKLKYLPLGTRLTQIERICNLVPVSMPDNLMMTSRQVRQLHNAGMEIGGHTVNHPILARMDVNGSREEIANGKDALEAIISGPVRLFAYPNGKPHQDYVADHVKLVKNLGFDGAVSTAWGAAKIGDDVYQLPRFTPWTVSKTKFTLHMAKNVFRKPEVA